MEEDKKSKPLAFEALKKILEEKANEGKTVIEVPDKVDNESLSGQLPKPNFQHVNPETINWVWNVVVDYISIESVYYKKDRNYKVTFIIKPPKLITNSTDLVGMDLTQDETKALGEALLSAWNWEHVWRQNAGDYLANDIDEKKDFINEAHEMQRLCICPLNGWSPECVYGNHKKLAVDVKRIPKTEETYD